MSIPVLDFDAVLVVWCLPMNAWLSKLPPKIVPRSITRNAWCLGAGLLLLGCSDPNVPPAVDDPQDLGSVAADGSAARDSGQPLSRTSLSGKITRTARPMNGGQGTLYVAVFEGNPVIDMKGARLIGRALIENVDFTSDMTAVPYRVENILPSQKETQVLAFLDDNKTAGTMNPGPDAGDLVTLEGLGGIKVKLTKDQENQVDLVLNAVIPKL